MRIIFHLGTYKTGSSSFQNMLFKNRGFLLQNGILYPTTGMAKNSKLGHRHTPLIHGYTSGKHDVCPEGFLKELDESNAETVILSSEAWARPAYLSHLTRFVCILQENGHHDCSGCLVLRNLERYQVSNYREFTVNQYNAASYQRYIQTGHGMFDYLLLARTFRSIFGSRFVALPFEGSQDITESLLSAIGMGDLYSRMKRVERGNVKSVSALEVEAMRCANFLKKPKNEGVSALQSIISEDSKLGDDVWTERYSGDVPIFTSAYRRSLRNTLDWSESETEAIFNQSAPEGRNVEELTSRLIDRLKSS
jgi:hypothetical protein